MKFTFSKHALEALADRQIPKEIALDVLLNPDKIVEEESGKHVYQVPGCLQKVKTIWSGYL